MMGLQKYQRLVNDLRETGRQAADLADEKDLFQVMLYSLKMLEAADDLEELLRYLERQEDDRK